MHDGVAHAAQLVHRGAVPGCELCHEHSAPVLLDHLQQRTKVQRAVSRHGQPATGRLFPGVAVPAAHLALDEDAHTFRQGLQGVADDGGSGGVWFRHASGGLSELWGSARHGGCG